jgi:hypothetical protein
MWPFPWPRIPITATLIRSLAPTIDPYDFALKPIPPMAIPAVPIRLFLIKSLLSLIFYSDITGLDFWLTIYQFKLKMSKIELVFCIFGTRKII